MEFFYKSYDLFLTIFPRDVQWLVSLIVILALIAAFYTLVRYHWGFMLLIVIFIPIAMPAFRSVIGDIYGAFLYIWQTTGIIINISPPK